MDRFYKGMSEDEEELILGDTLDDPLTLMIITSDEECDTEKLDSNKGRGLKTTRKNS